LEYHTRNYNLQNILYVDPTEDSELKIVDFGFARLKLESGTVNTPYLKLRLDFGSFEHEDGLLKCIAFLLYRPEALKQESDQEQQGYGPSCDVWSLGVILVMN